MTGFDTFVKPKGLICLQDFLCARFLNDLENSRINTDLFSIPRKINNTRPIPISQNEIGFPENGEWAAT